MITIILLYVCLIVLATNRPGPAAFALPQPPLVGVSRGMPPIPPVLRFHLSFNFICVTLTIFYPFLMGTSRRVRRFLLLLLVSLQVCRPRLLAFRPVSVRCQCLHYRRCLQFLLCLQLAVQPLNSHRQDSLCPCLVSGALHHLGPCRLSFHHLRSSNRSNFLLLQVGLLLHF